MVTGRFGRRLMDTRQDPASAGTTNTLKGLILAQNERWRRGLGMQVAGIQQWGTGVRGSNAWVFTLGSGIALRKKG